jgi:hypothetical protein
MMKHFSTIPTQRLFTTLVLTGILSLGASLTLLESASANSQDLSSSSTRQEKQQETRTNRLPPALANAVRREVAYLTKIPVGKLKVIQSNQETWPNGCLGIDQPDQICTQALVPGWRIVVSDGSKTWIYRTDRNGRVLRLEPRKISDAGTIKPTQIPTSELPAPLQKDAIFQAIASGGITGRTFQTTLLKDGRVLQATVNPNGTTSPTQIKRISAQQLRQFQQLLDQQQFSQFNRLNYPAPNGAADYITVTLTSKSGITRYADIVQNDLPESLRKIIQGWNQIASRS